MFSCPACAFPNLTGHVSCAYCDVQLLAPAPLLTQLTVRDGATTFSSGSWVLASATERTNGWLVESSSGDIFTLVKLGTEKGSELALFDTSLNIVASFCPAGSTPTSMVVRDSADELIATVRSDKCGGLNAVAPDGNVLLFAGRSGVDFPGLDVLVTDTGCHHPWVTLFALAIIVQSGDISQFAQHRTVK